MTCNKFVSYSFGILRRLVGNSRVSWRAARLNMLVTRIWYFIRVLVTRIWYFIRERPMYFVSFYFTHEYWMLVSWSLFVAINVCIVIFKGIADVNHKSILYPESICHICLNLLIAKYLDCLKVCFFLNLIFHPVRIFKFWHMFFRNK
jgi:hypothetical protein